jgi:DNA-binding NtrC family response regulator
MAHVLVYEDDMDIQSLLANVLEEEGYLVTTASTAEDALMILRTSLHPLIVVADGDYSFIPPDGPFFVSIRDHPEYYAQHRYIAIHGRNLTEDEEALMRELGVLLLLSMPFDFDHLFALLRAAATSLAQSPEI